MPRIAPEDRKRAYHPKTRTGCSACKRRRVKCGEERPACLRCTSTGRQCGGYGDPTTPLSDTQSKASNRPIVARPLSLPFHDQFSCDQERRSFEFFLTKTAPQLAGDFECAFWERLLLQAVHHEPAIRHVTVALGSLHEHFERDSGAPFRSGTLSLQNSFALRRYLQAMRCLMPTPGASQPIDVCLVSCILFVCYEAMRGHYGAAITHITSGLKILSELRNTPSSSNYLKPSNVGRTTYVPIDVLCGIFSRLQAQAIVTVPEKSSSFEKIWPDRVVDLSQPVVFNSLAHAREMLEIHTYDYRQQSIKFLNQQIQGNWTDPTTSAEFVPPVSPEAVALRDTFLSVLDSWSTALDNYLRDHSASMTIRQQRGAAILKVRELDSFISLDVIPSIGGLAVDNQMLWDNYIPLFQRMVTLGESIIQWFPYSSLSSSPTNFSLDLGIVGTLFNVAARCRDPRIRRHAIRVLRAAAVQDGVWNSAVVADIAEKWVEIEEEGLGIIRSCADVPPDSRLIHFLPVFDVDQCSALVYFSFTLKIDSGSVRREVFQW